jgi:hypothetical protein
MAKALTDWADEIKGMEDWRVMNAYDKSGLGTSAFSTFIQQGSGDHRCRFVGHGAISNCCGRSRWAHHERKAY